jgi:hypothetical protein
MADVIEDSWRRFFGHWSAASFGFFLRTLLPVLNSFTNPQRSLEFPRWYIYLALAALFSLVGGAINSNLPLKPREILKSVGLGFALDSAAILAKLTAGAALAGGGE